MGQRLIPLEPVYIIFNLGMSEDFGRVDKDNLEFPSKMLVDWIRCAAGVNSWQRGGEGDGSEGFLGDSGGLEQVHCWLERGRSWEEEEGRALRGAFKMSVFWMSRGPGSRWDRACFWRVMMKCTACCAGNVEASSTTAPRPRPAAESSLAAHHLHVLEPTACKHAALPVTSYWGECSSVCLPGTRVPHLWQGAQCTLLAL